MLYLEIVTPEALIFSGEVKFAVIPGIEGGLGILPEHMPLMTQILPGELSIINQEGELIFAVGEGFLEVRPDRVSILSDMAMKQEDIDENAAVEAVARAERAMREEALSGEELATVQSSLLRSLAQLHVKRRTRH